ncbi:hypothetical protein Aperf_G00000114633 [Anoplocephala perfoliata]
MDTEVDISVETSVNETFYDAVDLLNTVTCEISPKSFSGGDGKATDAKQLKNIDTSAMALNGTYALSSEASFLSCNKLPFLDNAIKSIQTGSHDEEIEFTTPISANCTNTDISIYQTPTDNNDLAKEGSDYPIEFHGILQGKDLGNSCDEIEEEIIEFRGEAKELYDNFLSENSKENLLASKTNVISSEVVKSSEFADQFLVHDRREITREEDDNREKSSDDERRNRNTLTQPLIESKEVTTTNEADLSIVIGQNDTSESPLTPTEDDIKSSEQEEESLFSILEGLREKRTPNPPKRILSPEEDAARNKFPRMSKEVLRKICKEQNLYQTPYLNDILYLHYRGFGWIENLEDYTGLRCLFLDVNGIDEIAGLEYQTEMRCLFLSKNLIKRIENLDHMIHLDTLDVSHNMITKIEKLSMLPALKKLIISHNKLETLEDVEHLRECKALSVVDLQQNRISSTAVLESVFAQMPSLRVLYNQGNPFVRDVKYYRKNFIKQCKELTYLDDRPVFPKDRACAEAFYRGGVEEESRVRKEINDAEHKRIMDSCNWLSERRKQIEAANREKELSEKGLANEVHINPEEMDRLYNENQAENPHSSGDDIQHDISNSDEFEDDIMGGNTVNTGCTHAEDRVSDSTESEIEEYTPSKILELSQKRDEKCAQGYAVTIESDSSDEPLAEVSRVSLKEKKEKEQEQETLGSKSIFDIYEESNSKLHTIEETTSNQSAFRRPLIEEIPDESETTDSVIKMNREEDEIETLTEADKARWKERGTNLKDEILKTAATIGSTDQRYNVFNIFKPPQQ